MMKELSEEDSEDSSDNLSDSQSTENNSSAIAGEGRRGRWMRRGTVITNRLDNTKTLIPVEFTGHHLQYRFPII